MIPAHIDLFAVISDLNGWGYGNTKIELVCGLSDGHVTHFMAGRRAIDGYQLVARIYNFWVDEAVSRGKRVPWNAPIADAGQHAVGTT
jgi:hypothetical protein